MSPEAKEQEEKMIEISKQMPAEAIRQMEKTLKSFYDERGVPFDATHLKASLSTCLLIMPALPPMYSEFISSATLLIYRLIDEQEKGEIPSDFVIPKKQ